MRVLADKSLPFNAIKDFAPISSVAQFDMLMMTKSFSPIRTLDDLMAMARERDDKKNRATTPAGQFAVHGGRAVPLGDKPQNHTGAVPNHAGRTYRRNARRRGRRHRILRCTQIGDRQRRSASLRVNR